VVVVSESVELVGETVTSMVTGAGATLIIEYPVVVTVLADSVEVVETIEINVVVLACCVRVITAVWVVSGPSIVFVETTKLVVGERVSVSMTVFVVGGGVCIIVSMTVEAAGEESPVEAAEPPSTATTE